MKREEKNELSKQKILQAALEEFGAKTYFGASVGQICTQYGISKGIIYHYFADKDALYLACCRECISGFLQYLNTADYIVADDADSSLKKYFSARFIFFSEHTYHFRIFYEMLSVPPRRLIHDIQEITQPLDCLNKEFFLSLLDSFPLRTGVSREDACTFFDFIQKGFHIWFNEKIGSVSSEEELLHLHEEYIKKTVDCMLYGIIRKES